MCNLYSFRASREEMRRRFSLDVTLELDLEFPTVYPDQDAPVVGNNGDGKREAGLMRWGFPPPPNAKARQVTNVRNYASPFWRPWLKKPYRCLVPFTAFSELGPDRSPHWFATKDADRLAAFAGIWRPWTGERLVKKEGAARRVREERDWRLFAFLTVEPNAVVEPIHPKAMPVILTEPEEFDIWLNGDDDQVLVLARPLEDAKLGEDGKAES